MDQTDKRTDKRTDLHVASICDLLKYFLLMAYLVGVCGLCVYVCLLAEQTKLQEKHSGKISNRVCSPSAMTIAYGAANTMSEKKSNVGIQCTLNNTRSAASQTCLLRDNIF